MHGCDSAVTLHLTIRDASENEFSDAGCGSYTWNGETYDITGDYQQTFLNAAGCDSVVTLHLTIHPEYHVQLQGTVCEGSGYYENGLDVSPQQIADQGRVVLEYRYTSSMGCDSMITLELTVIDTDLTIVADPPDLCEELRMVLTAETDFDTYQWSTGETTSFIEVTAPGGYSLTASNDNCSATASVTVQPCELELYLPNTITPSIHDGLNDNFCINEVLQTQMYDFSIHIYDRWGSEVFASSDKAFKWDGKVNGEIRKSTMYNYVIQYRDLYGEKFLIKGSLLVLSQPNRHCARL